jgi:hypothetical protein
MNKNYFLISTVFALHGENQNILQNNSDPLKDIDIKKEYELIQKKKSHLSKRLRDLVEYRYNLLKGKENEC